MQKIYLRADASAAIGYGHFIRTLALADMLKDDFDCTFFTCHPTPYQVSEMEKVCPFIPLQEESHYDEFLSLLQGDEIVVLDNYFFTTDYQRAIKQKGCCLVCVDDMHDKHYVADLIVNQGLGYTRDDYSCEPYTQFAFGLQFSLLRRPFFNVALQNKRNNYSGGLYVLVAFGGSDFLNLTYQTIHAIKAKDNVKKITAIVGDSYAAENMVDDPRVTYQKNLSAGSIADLFSTVDVAILPASTMMNEALACGTPVIGGYYVDNQEHDYYMFLREGLIQGAGDYTDAAAFTLVAENLDKITICKRYAITSDIPKRFVNLFKSLLTCK